MTSSIFKRGQVEWAVAHTIGGASGSDGPVPAHLRLNLKRLRDTDKKVGISDERLDLSLRRYAFLPQGPGERGLDTTYSQADAFNLLIGVRLLTSGFPQGAVVRLIRQLVPRLAASVRQIGAGGPDDSRPRFLVLPSGAGASLDWRRNNADELQLANICEAAELPALFTWLGRRGAPIVVIELTSAVRALTENLDRAPVLRRGRSRLVRGVSADEANSD